MPARSRVPVVIVAFLLTAVSGCAIANRMSGTSDARALQRDGVPAQATVTEIWDTGITVNDDPVVRLRVLVRPPAGSEYEAEIPRSRVSRVHVPQFQPGARVAVRIDPNDPAHVALDVYKYRPPRAHRVLAVVANVELAGIDGRSHGCPGQRRSTSMNASSLSESLRAQLARAVDWGEAHADFDKAVDGIPEDQRGARAPGFEHSPWQLVEHLRLAQKDLLDFCINPGYVHSLTWPDDYWPQDPAPSGSAWTTSIADFRADREKLKELIVNPAVDLLACVPTGTGPQIYLRAILLVIDHSAYHVGQLVAVRRALGIWG